MEGREKRVILFVCLIHQWQQASSTVVDRWKRTGNEVCLTLRDVTLSPGSAWTGNFNQKIIIDLKVPISDWKLTITFDKPVTSIEQWNFEQLKHENGKTFVLGPHKQGWNMELRNRKEWSYIIKYAGSSTDHPSIESLQLKGTVYNVPSAYPACRNVSPKPSDEPTTTPSSSGIPCETKDVRMWPGGQVAGVLIPVPSNMRGWNIELHFDSITSVKRINQWSCRSLKRDSTSFRCKNKRWNRSFKKSPFEFRYLMKLKSRTSKQPRLLEVKITGPGFTGYTCNTGIKPKTTPKSTSAATTISETSLPTSNSSPTPSTTTQIPATIGSSTAESTTTAETKPTTKLSTLETTILKTTHTTETSTPLTSTSTKTSTKSPTTTKTTTSTSSESPTTSSATTQKSSTGAEETTSSAPTSTGVTKTTPGIKTSSSSTVFASSTFSTVTAPRSSTDIKTSTAAPAPSCNTKYDYIEVLEKSLLFYEAQRSGRLPATNRIPWRGDSCLTDGNDVGLDLTGGYYDAGDGLKLTFPLAFTITLLSWGMIDYRKGYQLAHQENYGIEAIKWATDYFIKCHPSDNVFYGQVGDMDTDHSETRRIEDFTGYRPSLKIDASRPGTELAAETAAALAASSIVFETEDRDYSKTLIDHAEKLYLFGKTKRGKYSNYGFKGYPSYDEGDDELAWAAAWLYRATKKSNYLQEAESIYSSKGLSYRPSEFSWSTKIAGVQTLLLQLTGKSQYKNAVSSFTSWLRNEAYKTPKGLVWLQQWGSNRHAANVALICLVAADQGISKNENRDFARKQINYMLGDSGRSYVVGFGHNPPKRPHHRNSACFGGCKTWSEFNAATDNAYVLYGALVGGPGRYDDYVDTRTDYVKNEVANDYNAGFQSAVAALISLDCGPAIKRVSTTHSPTISSTTPILKSTVTATDVSTTPATCSSKYDYIEVLEKSLLFYEAQRSGKLPATNRIPWRGDSCLTDGNDVGLDLTGGYYDAGDGLKLTFPLAFTITLLSWGMIDYRKGYQLAQQENYGIEAIKWATDYFIKCHPSDNVFYGQVGDMDTDHSETTRIEDFTGYRPSLKIDASRPGTELAAETAAALAASSIVFETEDRDYSKTLIEHAEKLYLFGKTKRGKYSNYGFKGYPSYDEGDDELAWAAAWLYRATKKSNYLQDAESIYSSKGLSYRPSEFSWSTKIAGVQTLLLQLTGKSQYKNAVSSFTSWLRNEAYKTPKGLVWLQQWGSNRHAANVALICLVAADQGISKKENRDFARKQINYMLGDSGRSYVVGFGHNPPKRPHHRNSACFGGCKTWSEFNAATDNAYVLYGALVGGPGRYDDYVDTRTDYVKNEVANDYNAGFQSAVAALVALDCRN